jgi:hypothetical protein
LGGKLRIFFDIAVDGRTWFAIALVSGILHLTSERKKQTNKQTNKQKKKKKKTHHVFIILIFLIFFASGPVSVCAQARSRCGIDLDAADHDQGPHEISCKKKRLRIPVFFFSCYD